MRIYVSVDMEGIAGVVHVDQTRRSGHDYEKARRWMTLEVNAAARGAMDRGADEVVINDAHGDMRNLLLDELDPRVSVISGSLKPLSMVQGVDAGFGAAFFVGYHAGAASQAGILDHTYYGKVVARCRLGGRPVDEATLNAIVCGEAGVPIALITGDATACAQARASLGDLEAVVVKDAITRYAARTVTPEAARISIYKGAGRATERAGRGEFAPYRPLPPHVLEVDFVNAACADVSELVPGTERVAGTTTRYSCPDGTTLVKVIQAWTVLSASTMV